MGVEGALKQFINSTNILPSDVLFEIKPEYLDDSQPQVYILREKSGKFQKRIRIISNRYNAITTEEKVCLLLEMHLSEHFYPQIYKKFKNVSGLGDILITEYKEGISLDKCIFDLSEIEFSMIVDQLCKDLKKIHSIKSSGFSDLAEFTDDNWFDFFEYKLKKYLNKALDNKILTNEEIEYLVKLLYREQDIFKQDYGSLIHFDVKPANIIWDCRSKEISLIDFEMSRYADILMEFTKGKFTTLLFNNSVYKNKIWIPLVEQYFSQPYTDVFSSRKAVWYLFYHYLAHCNYQLCCYGVISPCILNEFIYYKRNLLA
ncbi:MAG: aminoglycoside phosphotransferase family protein [Lachnospiraceae bacterium]|nr:aminoglycoside phosphotransferase family protein [Lachnospiraceae bacterium]